jgi:Leucine-rich repeat (LRR) protein
MNERTIFFEALDRDTPAERSAYLDAACGGDGALRRRVEALLHSHEGAGNFLGQTAPMRLAAEQAGRGEPGPTSREPLPDDGAEPLSFLSRSDQPGVLGRLGHYEVQQVIGRGGFGIVLKAFDERLQRPVALKVLAPALAATSAPRRRFLREARAAAAVRHENVVTIYAVEEQPLPYLVMEYVGGENLQQRLDRLGPLDVPAVLRIGRQVAAGLAAAHEQGLAHRDIKPANLLLEGRGDRVKISDFGLARTADDASLTQSGYLAGTPLYMAPEQARGEALDPRADLFSLGSVLYVMCTGRPPFRAPSTLAVLKRVAEDTPRPIREIIPEVPEWVCALIARLHAKEPGDRFASAQEVADLLAGVGTRPQPLGGAPPAPGPAGAVAAASAPPRHARRRWLVAAAVVLLLLAGWGLTEAAGVTDVRGLVIRLFSPEGTLVVEVDDPAVSVSVEGEDVVITGAGAKEIRLKPGQYKVEASKDGKVVSRELVTVNRNGRQVVRVSKESVPSFEAGAWEKSVAALPAEEQVEAVARRLKELNPDFDGMVTPAIRYGHVAELTFHTHAVKDLSPVRALRRLEALACYGPPERRGILADLSPLRGLPLKTLSCFDNPVSDLSPLAGMRLEVLNCFRTEVEDLTPLKGMPLTVLSANGTRIADVSPLKGMSLTRLLLERTSVSDLSPLRGMKLTTLDVSYTRVGDLSPLEGMPLTVLCFTDTAVSDLSPLKDMPLSNVRLSGTRVTDLALLKGKPLKELQCDFRCERDAALLRSLTTLEMINSKPVADFWKEVDGQ